MWLKERVENLNDIVCLTAVFWFCTGSQSSQVFKGCCRGQKRKGWIEEALESSEDIQSVWKIMRKKNVDVSCKSYVPRKKLL